MARGIELKSVHWIDPRNNPINIDQTTFHCDQNNMAIDKRVWVNNNRVSTYIEHGFELRFELTGRMTIQFHNRQTTVRIRSAYYNYLISAPNRMMTADLGRDVLQQPIPVFDFLHFAIPIRRYGVALDPLNFKIQIFIDLTYSIDIILQSIMEEV